MSMSLGVFGDEEWRFTFGMNWNWTILPGAAVTLLGKYCRVLFMLPTWTTCTWTCPSAGMAPVAIGAAAPSVVVATALDARRRVEATRVLNNMMTVVCRKE